MIKMIVNSKIFPDRMDPLVRVFLLFNTIVTFFCFYTGGVAYKSFVIVGVVSTIGVLLGWRGLLGQVRLAGLLGFIERHSILLLVLWGLIYLAWCGLVIFSNPYRYGFNQGDATIVTQALWNLVHGLRPELSVITLNGPVSPGEDPRFPSAYGYVSLFTVMQNWLPLVLLTPLYAIFPHPPMHVFAVQICIIVIGLPGMYWAVRKAGGSSVFALFATIGYSLLPQVDSQLFFHAYIEPIGLALLPWLFGALLSRKWVHLYVFALLTALISFPFAQFVIVVGLTALFFFRAIVPGVVLILIGWLVVKIDTAIITSALSPYFTNQEVPSMFKHYVLDRTIGSFQGIVEGNVWYIFSLLQSVAFLPIFALWQNGRLNRDVLGFFFMLCLAFGASLFRSYGWEFQRNSFFIVPIYMMGVIAYLALQQDQKDSKKQNPQNFLSPSTVIFSSALIAVIFFGNPYNSNPKSPLACHFPWGNGVTIAEDEESAKWKKTLMQFNKIIPEEAHIAVFASQEIEAVVTNRQNVWGVSQSPEGVKYYAFIGEAGSAQEKVVWESYSSKFKNDKNFKVIYDENPGKPMLIFENLHAYPWRRNEELLGWSVLQPSKILRQLLSN